MTLQKYLSPTSPEWPAMWEALADATGDYADCNPQNGECWQYMGTYDGVHQFRHRHRPESAKPIQGYAGQAIDRVYLQIDAETLTVTGVHVRRYFEPAKLGPAPRPAAKKIGPFPAHCASNNVDQWELGWSDADPGL